MLVPKISTEASVEHRAWWVCRVQSPYDVYRERETVVVFITKQIIELHLDYYIHRAVSILQTGKKRAKLP
jgi:hypothetical protein